MKNKKLSTIIASAITLTLGLSGCGSADGSGNQSDVSNAYAGRCDELFGVAGALSKMNQWIEHSGGAESLNAQQRKDRLVEAGYTTVNEYMLDEDASWQVVGVMNDTNLTSAEQEQLDDWQFALYKYRMHFSEEGYDVDSVIADLYGAVEVSETACGK